MTTTTTINTISLTSVNAYLIQGQIEGKTIYVLVDTGYKGNHKKIIRTLDTLGIKLSQIKLIILTHGHSDHYGSLKKMVELTKAQVLTSELDFKIMKEGLDDGIKGLILWTKVVFGLLSFMPKRPPKKLKYQGDILINSDYSLEDYGIQGQVVLTPGHTKGSLSVLLDDGQVLIGDNLMDFTHKGKPKRPIIAYDLATIKASMNRLIEKGATRFYLSHGSEVTLDDIKEALKTLY